MTRRLLVTGGDGQVGQAMRTIDAPDGMELVFPSRQDFDLSDAEGMRAALFGSHYDGVINLAAYTAVDKAEENAQEAFLVNCDGPAQLADLTAELGIPLVHVSTDYVFSGELDRPYREEDATGPINVYGASKEAGEREVRARNLNHAIVRASWVVSPYRSNFVKTMIRLAAERETLRVVDDQRGAPTSASELAGVLLQIATSLTASSETPRGTFHFSNAGNASWAEIAEEIMRQLTQYGRKSANIERIATSEYPTPARRPKNSSLDTSAISEAFSIRPDNWRDAIGVIVSDIVKGGRQ